MRVGLATSTALHAGLLGYALVSIAAPAPLEVADVEALPVEIVSLEEFSQIVKGSKDAPKLDAPNPEPTVAEPTVDDAANVGEAEVDVAVEPAPVVKPVPVEAPTPDTTPEPDPNTFEIADVPAPTERPEPPREETVEIAEAAEPPVPVTPEPEPDVAPEPVEIAKAEPVPAEPEPAVDPVKEAIEAAAETSAEPEKAEPQFAALPTGGPKALFRPRPRSQAAKTPERRTEAVTERTSTPKETGERNVTDEIAALLNQEKASGGGAKRTERPASAGGRKTTGTTLSNSEMDMLRRAIGRCWSPPAGAINASELVVKVRMRLDQSGNVVGRPEVLETAGGRLGDVSGRAAARAMRACAPYDQLPAEKFETWSEVVVNFDPRDMF